LFRGRSPLSEIASRYEFPWELLKDIQKIVDLMVGDRRVIRGQVSADAYVADNGPLFIGEGAIVEAGAFIASSTYVGAGATVRHGAYVRSQVILGDGAILGHASEAKTAVLMEEAKAPHFAYVGDSILGQRVNLGAGTKLSNLTITSLKSPVDGRRPTIRIPVGDEILDTGLGKMGAVLGDDVQTGCNAVLNPGVIVGVRSMIYANLSIPKGIYAADTIFKLRQAIDVAVREPS
jgi:NDP-sugar pyrophosphorylase family protein